MKQQHYVLVFTTILLLCGSVHKSAAAPNKYVSTDSLWKQVKKHYKSSPDLALKFALVLQKEAKNNGNKEHEANALWSIAFINYNKGNLNESVEAYFKAIPIYNSLENKELIGKAYYNIGKILTDTKNDVAAEEFYNKALNIYTLINNRKSIANTNMQLGKTYVNIKKYAKAETHLNVALKLAKEHNKKIVHKIYNWLGIMASNQGNYKLAKQHFNESLKISKQESNKEEVIVAIFNLGEVHFRANDLINSKEFAEKALTLGIQINDTDKQIKPRILLAKIAAKQKGKNIAEVNALVTTTQGFDATQYNAYLQEALYYLSEKPQQDIVAVEDLKEMMRALAVQSKISSELYEKTKTLLNQHSLQLSIDKVKNEQKVEALEENNQFKNWALGLAIFFFISIVTWVLEHGKFKRNMAKDSFDSNIKKVENRISKVVKNIDKKETELEEEAIRNMGLVEELKVLKNENFGYAEQLESMTSELIQTNTTMQEMNRYVWEIFKDINQQGYKLLPPPWHLGDDRNN